MANRIMLNQTSYHGAGAIEEIVNEAINIYNTKRPHWSNDLLTPQQMHNQQTFKIKSYKTKNSSKLAFTTV